MIELGESIELDLSTNGTITNYDWSPDVVDCESDCIDLEFFPTNSQIYSLTATSESGCLASDSIFVEVEKVRKVFIPNIFSPNFDGTNDYFTPYGAIPNVQRIQKCKSLIVGED